MFGTSMHEVSKAIVYATPLAIAMRLPINS